MSDDEPTAEQMINSDALTEWLANKPFEWAPALATRAALRSLPWTINYCKEDWLVHYIGPMLHSLFVAWSTSAHPVKGHKYAAGLAASLLYPAAMRPEPEAYFASAMRHICVAIQSKTKKEKVEHSTSSIRALHKLVLERVHGDFDIDLYWGSIARDVRFLNQRFNSSNKTAKYLIKYPFVDFQYSSNWKVGIEIALNKIRSEPLRLEFFADWLEGVYSRRDFVFSVARQMADESSKSRSIEYRLIEEISPGFWSSAPADVNKKIEDMISDIFKNDEESITNAGVPSQNKSVISFSADAEGKIGLSDSDRIDIPRGDVDAVDRYVECVFLARELKARCEGSNSAGRMASLLNRYIEAAGESVEELRPSLFVQRGERLRQELQAYEGVGTMLPPLSDDILLDLRAWQASHNMLVGLDPALMERDEALFGPSARQHSVPPEEIRALAVDADNAGLLRDNVVEVIIEAADLAPKDGNPEDRRSIWSFETGRNLVIETFNVAMRHPGKSATGVLLSGAAVSTLGVAGTVVSLTAASWPAAKFLLRHREWIETRLGDTPTWKALFEMLCDWLERETPIKNDG